MMGLFKPSVKSLVGRGDVRGLIARLNQKDWAEASLGLQVLRERAVPALIELLGTGQEGTACAVLVNIGAPALSALAEVIRSGRDDRLAAASTAIITIREKGVRLPDGVVATLEAVKAGGPEVDIGRRAMAASALGKMELQSLERLIRTDVATQLPAAAAPPAPQELERPRQSAADTTPEVAGSASQVEVSPVTPHTLEGHSSLVSTVAVSPASADGSPVIHTEEAIHLCAISPDGSWIVSSAWGYPEPGALKVWKVATGYCLHTFPRQTTGVGDPLAVSPDSTWFVSAGGSMTTKEFVLRIWDVATGSCRHTLIGHTHWVHDCAVGPDGTWLVSASNDHSLRIWDVATGTCRNVLVGHKACVLTCTVSPDGTWIVSTGDDGTLRIWDVATGACRHILVGHTEGKIKTGFAEVLACAVSHDGTWVVSGGCDETLRIWDVTTGTCRHLLVGHNGAVFHVLVSPDGKWIVSGSNSNLGGYGTEPDLRVWDPATGVCLHVLRGHTDSVQAVAVSPDGRYVVSASRDHTLRIWDPHTGVCLRNLVGHEGGVASVAVSPDSTWIVSTDYDKTLRIWDVATGTCQLPRSPRCVNEPVLRAPSALDQAQPPTTPSPDDVLPTGQIPVTTWTAGFVLDAVRRALTSVSLTEGTVRISIDGLTPADFHSAVNRLKSVGCADVTGMDFPPSGPGLSIDTGQLYQSDPGDPRLHLIIDGIGDNRLVKESPGGFLLTAIDLAIDLVRSLKTPLKEDRIAVALHVVPSDVDAVLKVLQQTTGRPPGHGFALRVCFAADRTEQSRGYPKGSNIEVG